MRIAIFETDHFEVAYPLIKLFDNTLNEITVFVYQDAYRQLELSLKDKVHRYAWVVKPTAASKYSFVYRMYREIKRKNIELLYFNTLSDNFLLYYLLVRGVNIRTVLTLHDINGYFSARAGLSIRHRINYMGKRLLVNRIKEFNVISHTMVSYLKSKLPYHKKVYCIPGAIYEPYSAEYNLPEFTRTIQSAVPGTIDQRRRDYELVFELLHAARVLSLPISVVLLGSYYGDYGKKVLERCRSYVQQYDNLKFYDTDVVDQPEFNRMMKSAHLLLMPCVTGTVVFDNAAEKYGISKSSGTIYDVVRYAKPFIVPALLQFDEYLEKSCMRYNDVKEIMLHLEALLQQPGLYKDLQQNAVEACMYYTVPAIRRRNPGIL